MPSEQGPQGPRIEPRFDSAPEADAGPPRDAGADDAALSTGRSRRRVFRRRVAGALVALAALGGFGGIAWYATSQGQRGAPEVVPVIQAEKGPEKVKPGDPGGLEVPNRDKLVYERIAPEAGGPAPDVERLLPPPETPMARPAPESDAEAESAPPSGPLVPEVPEIRPRAGEAPAPPPTPASETETAAKPPPPAPQPKTRPGTESGAAVNERNPDTAAPSGEEPVAAPKDEKKAGPTQTAAIPGDAYQVQVAAFRDEASARAEAARLAKAHEALLGELEMRVVRADLGSRGVFYRLRAGPLPDRGAADALCRKLAARKLGCIVVNP